MMKILSGIAGCVFLVFAAAQAEAPPIGAHDPEAITCNGPELAEASKQRGWPLCVQNDMLDGRRRSPLCRCWTVPAAKAIPPPLPAARARN
jgi:hypothetical protein